MITELFAQLETCESVDDVDAVLRIARANGLDAVVINELRIEEHERVNRRIGAVILAEILEGCCER